METITGPEQAGEDRNPLLSDGETDEWTAAWGKLDKPRPWWSRAWWHVKDAMEFWSRVAFQVAVAAACIKYVWG